MVRDIQSMKYSSTSTSTDALQRVLAASQKSVEGNGVFSAKKRNLF
jgi:hypothetical protein